MSNSNPKALAFVGRLLQNPALQQLSPLQREEQILQFLQVNARQLYPTLSTPGFFPGLNWEQITGNLVTALAEIIDQELMPALSAIVMDRLDLSFIQFIRQQNMPQSKIKEDLLAFLKQMLQKRDARRDFAGAFSALDFSYSNRYLDQAFSRKQYVHFELTKVQRLRMGKDEMKNYIDVSLLLKPTVHLLALTQGNGEVAGGTVQAQFIEKVVAVLAKKLPALPEQIIRSGVYANGSFLENRSLDATSRIAGILASMCRNAKQNQKVDRGADTADKSWINIARRNYKFYGFDIKMLDEFYKIAGENGW
jgi:hypothetical protein